MDLHREKVFVVVDGSCDPSVYNYKDTEIKKPMGLFWT